MITEIYLVRHGETEWNKSGRFQGCIDISLSEEGITQATYLKNRFNGDFDYILSSPLIRAVQTANIICEDLTNIDPILVPQIREINFGEWEGLNLEQIKQQYPDEFQNWRTDDEYANLVGGELSLKTASLRAKEALMNIAMEYQNKRIIVVAHGGILKAGLLGLFDWKMTMYHKMMIGNTSVTKIIFDKSNVPILYSLNDTSHLPTNYKIKSYV